jgi:hypothetical protein
VFSVGKFCYGTPQAELLIPAKTKVSIELLSPISTQTGRKGDKFSCRIITPAEFAGAIVEGHIRDAKRSGKANKESKLDLAFDRIVTVEGRIADFNATVVEVFEVANVGDQGRADNEGVVRNKSTTVKTSIKRAALGALIGAGIGAAIGGGQGAAVGAAIGAGLGVTTTLATKGPDLEFKTGTQFTVETNGPVRRRAAKNGESAVALASSTYQPPALPSAQTRLRVLESYSVAIPENWRDFANEGAMLVAPDGGYRLINGKPEVTHGALLGIVDGSATDLNIATDNFLQTMLNGNSQLDKREPAIPSLIAGQPALLTMLSGKGKEGRVESVAVHTAILPNRKLLFIIGVVPEAEANAYVEAFKVMVQSVKLKQ